MKETEQKEQKKALVALNKSLRTVVGNDLNIFLVASRGERERASKGASQPDYIGRSLG